MSNIAIKVENLSKAYQLGQIGTGTISRDLERWYARVRGKEDPFLRIGETNDRSSKGTSDVVWSLKDINFEIEQGDAVGIIGRNGAGKSTLLKILSKVTAPTTGKITGKGRIASLLEVGTGFHPELSGRENIFLNGAILGMRKKEIQRKLEEIVDFAGIERYLDTPVKRYSSGMYVRLAFAVAAHLESEILIVDEVLAVGDAEFQKKCLGKMGEVSKGEGRTVLFVSHNMVSIKQLCNKGLLLTNGTASNYNEIPIIINDYLNQNKNISRLDLVPVKNRIIDVLSILLKNSYNIETSEISVLEPWSVTIYFQVNEEIRGLVCAVGIVSLTGIALKTTWHEPSDLKKGKYAVTFFEENSHYATGTYLVHVGLSKNKENIQFIEDAIQFEIVIGNAQLNKSKLDYSVNTGILIDQMKSTLKTND
ncbi:ABC transporter ATP-binding protein [Pedobacter cryotolerans]|uniref:ABC transporter ATP-binding protein n=1 Tax=Pedobacter cryotolerans TaxID=2571270 RepID=A0A4U1BYJ7_9SPHI|nr:ABC transporter ATP-binding protein [Pedobacter cryotolerans]TKB98239.1 ABC transporter ATP-binding protein [Pedobacter cryotolerans]